jgi:hypothetical protein
LNPYPSAISVSFVTVYAGADSIVLAGQEKRIFFLGAKPGGKNFLQTNGEFLC